jgi:hypothetical protein
MNKGKHEQIVIVQDLDAGLRAIIAIHSQRLGEPDTTEEQALRDSPAE